MTALTPPADLKIRLPYRRGRRPAPCPCDNECGVRSGFCPEHLSLLHRVPVEFETEAKARGLEGRQAKSPQRPVCSTIGCWNPRTPPFAQPLAVGTLGPRRCRCCSGCAEESE